MILSLDLASNCGWAAGSIGSTPTHGTIRFAPVGSPMVDYFRGLELWVHGFIIDNPKLSLVVFEAPIAPARGRTTLQTLRILYGLPAVLETFLARNFPKIAVHEAAVSDVRRHFIGRGNYASKIAKEMTMRKCRSLGWEPSTLDAADACAAWHYQCSLIKPELAIEVSPLYRRGAVA